MQSNNLVNMLDQLIDNSETLIKLSYKYVKMFSVEPIHYGDEQLDQDAINTLKSTIANTCQKYFYCNEDFDVFDICSSLFWTIINGHKLKNGNKRFAVTFLIIIMFLFGYVLNKDNTNTYLEIEQQILTFIVNYQNVVSDQNIDRNIANQQTINQIKKWLKSNSIKNNLSNDSSLITNKNIRLLDSYLNEQNTKWFRELISSLGNK